MRLTKGILMLFNRIKDHLTRIIKLESIQDDRGFVDYNDLATATTPIVCTAGVATKLTNDKLGAFTNTTYAPTGITSLWDTSTNQLDFSQLKLGDQLVIRVDITPTTLSTNTDITLGITLGIGGSEYTLNYLSEKPFKTIQEHTNDIIDMHIYMGDLNTLNNPGELRLTADKTANVKVNGWYIRVN